MSSAMKGLDDLIGIATTEVLKKRPYCLKHYKYLEQKEIDFKRCVEVRCSNYIELDDIEKHILEKEKNK